MWMSGTLFLYFFVKSQNHKVQGWGDNSFCVPTGTKWHMIFQHRGGGLCLDERKRYVQELEASVKVKGLVGSVYSHSRFWIFSDSFLKEVCFPLEAYHFHPFKRVACFVVFAASKGDKQAVGTKLDIVVHHGRIHSNELNWEGVHHKFHLNVTALLMISAMHASGRRLISLEYSRQGKLQCSPFLQLMSLLLKLRPGMSLCFFSQNMAQKEPEKKMPSPAANAMMHLAKLALVGSHHLSTQFAFRWMHGTVFMAWSKCSFSAGSLIYVSMSRE